MNRSARLRHGSALMLFVLAVLAVPAATIAQTTAPVRATLVFQSPPPGNPPSFSTTTPIAIVLQIQNASGGAVLTTQGFSDTDFFRQLFFTLPGGGTLSNPAAIVHRTLQPFQCLSRSGVLLSPAITVVPVETLAGPPTPFFLEFQIPDARAIYNDLTQPGLYTVTARFPLLTFNPSDPNAVITDCDQFPGTTLVNVSSGGAQEFTVVSNGLAFFVCCLNFSGFGPPVGPAVASPCSSPPTFTTNFGKTIPVKFQLFDAQNQPVTTAVASISAQTCGGQPLAIDLGQGSVPTNQFKFDAANNQYVFNLDTKVLAPGAWQINATINDGSTHSVLIQLQ